MWYTNVEVIIPESPVNSDGNYGKGPQLITLKTRLS